MEVLFKKTFIKDFEKLPSGEKEKVREVCFYIFPEIKNLTKFTKYPIRKIKGFKNYYSDFYEGFTQKRYL